MIRLKYYLQTFFARAYSNTIFAVATNSSKPSPINVLRVSGPESYKCLSLLSIDSIINNSKKQLFNKFKIKPRYAHNATLYTQEKVPIDRCLLLYFPEGKSYNDEDIFQFHLHGSPSILRLMFQQLFKLGFRIAQPGQFTKRALINGKMNLLQVQGLHQLIHSQNQFSRKIAMGHILGQTSTFLQQIKTNLVSCLAACQAFIDFGQDQSDVKDDLFDKTKIKCIDIVQQIKKILAKRKQIQTLSNGINLVIVGKPNAGKSTIMNKLVNQEVAIVSDEPGTTRDIIKSEFQYKGMSFKIFDTAGIRQTQQKIQKQGIRRAIQKTKYSHLNMLIIDGSSEDITYEEDKTIIKIDQSFDQTIFRSQKTVLILNKIDLMKQLKNEILIRLGQTQRQIDISLSALHNVSKTKQTYNIEEHKQQIFFSRQRHFDSLEQSLYHLEQYLKTNQVDIASEELRLAILEIGKILGRVDCQDVLDVLFKDFCIGK